MHSHFQSQYYHSAIVFMTSQITYKDENSMIKAGSSEMLNDLEDLMKMRLVHFNNI